MILKRSGRLPNPNRAGGCWIIENNQHNPLKRHFLLFLLHPDSIYADNFANSQTGTTISGFVQSKVFASQFRAMAFLCIRMVKLKKM
ncbi:hypothetical protein [Methylophaga sp.]|uniref:hypothetical protein n=1 Tax=Methylophaga sp. TaxID=2024840 RepID=UPI00272A16E0|nr:hypothetical protein [Methylophaga sp.]